MNQLFSRTCLALLIFPLPLARASAGERAAKVQPQAVLDGLKAFWAKTGQPDGSFRPGIDPDYKGMSDSALSDMAPLTYAVTLHRTFGWRLPYEKQTLATLLARQKADGAFYHVIGTGDPKVPLTRVYNTTQGLVALHALGARPRYDPLPVFAQVLAGDYRKLPLYTTSFFPLAYQCYGKPLPADADRKLRASDDADRRRLCRRSCRGNVPFGALLSPCGSADAEGRRDRRAGAARPEA